MARFVKKLGTQQMRFQFDIELHSIQLAVPYTCKLQIVWKKDQKRLESKNTPTIGGGESANTASFDNEKLSMISGLFRDPKTGKLTEKSCQLVIKLLKGEKSKSCGIVCLNLANYINEQLTNDSGQGHDGNFQIMLSMPIEKCPDKNGQLHFTICSQLISITAGSETMSMMSGLQSTPDGASQYSFGDDSQFKFQEYLDNSNNHEVLRRHSTIKDSPKKILDDANEDDQQSEVAQAYGATGKKGSLKRRNQSSQQQIKNKFGAGGIPKPQSIAEKNDKVPGTSSESEEIIQEVEKPKDFLQVDLDEILEPENPSLEEDNSQILEVSFKSLQKSQNKSKPSAAQKAVTQESQPQPAALDSITSQLREKLQTEMQQNIEEQMKQKYEQALQNAIQAKTQQTQAHMVETVTFQKKIDQLIQEKTALNDKYQKQLNQVLREKEELMIAQSSQEDKIQKMEMDREHLKLKNKQQQEDQKKVAGELLQQQGKVAGLQKQVETLQGTLEHNQRAVVEDKKEQEARGQMKIDELLRIIDEKGQQFNSKCQEVKEQGQIIQDKSKLEAKLRQQIDELQESQSYNQSQNELQMNKKIMDLDARNEQMTKDISAQLLKIDQLQEQLDESSKKRDDLIFKLDFADHKIQDEISKNKTLVQQLNSVGFTMEQMKKEFDGQKQELEEKNAKLTREMGELGVTGSANERRLKEKDKKIQQLDSKIIELQEDGVSRINEYEREISNMKQTYEYQLMEFKKRIAEMEELVTSSKQQVKRAQESKASDIQILETELRELKSQTAKEIQTLEDKNKELQTQLNGIESNENKGEEDKKVEEQNAKQLNIQYKIEIGKLKQQVKELKEINSNLNEEVQNSPKSVPESTEVSNESKQKIAKVKLQLRDQIIRANELESQLIEAKMHWAKLDMKNDELTQKLKLKEDKLAFFTQHVTTLEHELVQSKQQMGDALNQLHELELLQLDQFEGTPGQPNTATPGPHKSDESGGSEGEVYYYYVADDKKTHCSTNASTTRRESTRRESHKSPTNINKFNMSNMFKSLKTKMELSKKL